MLCTHSRSLFIIVVSTGIPTESPTNADNLSQEEQSREEEKPFCSQSALSISQRMGIRISRKGTKPLIKLILFANKHTMLHVLRLLTNVLKAPPSSKRWDFLRNASNPMKQGRNLFEEMLFITHHTNSHPSKILEQRRQNHALERDDAASCLRQNLIQSLRHRKASIRE